MIIFTTLSLIILKALQHQTNPYFYHILVKVPDVFYSDITSATLVNVYR